MKTKLTVKRGDITKEQVDAIFNAAGSEDYQRMLLVMEMACEPPEIKFRAISSQAGLEVVEKARGCKRNEQASLKGKEKQP